MRDGFLLIQIENTYTSFLDSLFSLTRHIPILGKRFEIVLTDQDNFQVIYYVF